MMEVCHRMKRHRDRQGLLGRLLASVAVATVLLACEAPAAKTDSTGPVPKTSGKLGSKSAGKLAGWLLVAAPRMRDPNFARTVIFLLHHDDGGAMGLIVNRPAAVEPASKLLERLTGEIPPIDNDREVRIHYGGPVQPSRGFFIHSNDYAGKGTVAVTDRVSLTNIHDILRAMASGKGPTKGFLALGYAGWSPGQLENEMKRKDWITVSPDDGLVFDDDMQSKWQRAIAKRGADL